MSVESAASRTSFFRLALLGLVPLALGAVWLRSAIVKERDDFLAFCRATRRAEPWEQVQARAAAKGFGFVQQSRTGAVPQEYLSSTAIFGYRLGCTVVVKDGRVVETRDGELPAE